MRLAVALLLLGGSAIPAIAQNGNGNGNGKGQAGGSESSDITDDPFDHLPDAITLTGTVRDFRERHIPGGHPDFELRPALGLGHYVGMVRDTLSSDGKPQFASTGFKVLLPWTTASGMLIGPTKPYITRLPGDVFGVTDWRAGGALTSSSRFAQWFRDVPGVNMSDAFPITLEREPASNVYVYDDRLDTHFADMEGFFLVNDKLYGNSQGGNKNFHFTYELQANFVFDKGAGQAFTFRGDDDVWVFIDKKLVIDIGGVHDSVEQTIQLDRLAWLKDGQTYQLSFFFAERHRTESNFRIETSIQLDDVNQPSTSALHD